MTSAGKCFYSIIQSRLIRTWLSPRVRGSLVLLCMSSAVGVQCDSATIINKCFSGWVYLCHPPTNHPLVNDPEGGKRCSLSPSQHDQKKSRILMVWYHERQKKEDKSVGLRQKNVLMMVTHGNE